MLSSYDIYRTNTKMCCNCLERKPKEAFRARAKAKDGLTARCKACLATKDGKKRLKLIEMQQLGIKQCRSCGDMKPLDQMIRAERNLMQVGSYCKPCHNRRCQARYQERVINPEDKKFQPEAFRAFKLATPKGRREFIAACQFAPEMLTLEANRKLFESIQLEMQPTEACQALPAETSGLADATLVDTTTSQD